MNKQIQKSNALDFPEAIYKKIVSDLSFYDPLANDICVRGWDADLSSIINERLNGLNICVLVGSPEMSAIDNISGGVWKASVKVSVQSLPMLQDSSVVNWSAYDVADLLARLIDGYTIFDTKCPTPHEELRVSTLKFAREGADETAEFTITTILNRCQN